MLESFGLIFRYFWVFFKVSINNNNNNNKSKNKNDSM